ncbi:hypothetical protein DRP04_15305 [Archaeoglobales archaeon]|nr:MAG: hypothetical protein DRP04_15305 [Archaeoglobales archaeon]
MNQEKPKVNSRDVLSKAYGLVKKDAKVDVFRKKNYVAVKVTPKNPKKVIKELKRKSWLIKKFFSGNDSITLVDIITLKKSFAIIYKYQTEEEAKEAEKIFKEIFFGAKNEGHSNSAASET